jgi:hypothetical protein
LGAALDGKIPFLFNRWRRIGYDGRLITSAEVKQHTVTVALRPTSLRPDTVMDIHQLPTECTKVPEPTPPKETLRVLHEQIATHYKYKKGIYALGVCRYGLVLFHGSAQQCQNSNRDHS